MSVAPRLSRFWLRCPVHLRLWAVLVLTAASIAIPCTAAESATVVTGPAAAPGPAALVTFREGRFSEFLVDASGRVWLFPAQTVLPVEVWGNGEWSQRRDLPLPGTVCGVARASTDAAILLCQSKSEQVDLVRFAGAQFTPVASLKGRLQSPTLHMATDGVIWVLSTEGMAYGAKASERFEHAFGPAIDKGRPVYRYYPPTMAVDVPGCGTWFWSYAQNEAFNLGARKAQAIAGFEVCRGGRWTRLPPPTAADGTKPVAPPKIDCWWWLDGDDDGTGMRTLTNEVRAQVSMIRHKDELGGVALLPDGRVVCGRRYGGYCTFLPWDGVVKALPIAAPADEGCLFLHATPNGGLLTVTARPAMFTRLAPTKGGWLGTLLAFDGQRTRVLLDGVDFGRGGYSTGRPVVDTPAGTFLAATRAGLVFVPIGGQKAYRLDWRHGVPVPNVTRLRADDRFLYALDPERGLAIIDWRRLAAAATTTPAPAEWEVHATAGAAYLAADEGVWLLTAGVPGALRRSDGAEWSDTSLRRIGFPPEHLWYLTSDTRGRIWLFSDSEIHQTALLDHDRWRNFELRETAYSTVALEEKGNPGFRVGIPRDHCYPAFAGDGRVAYQNEWRRICSFDGKAKWDVGSGDGDIGGLSPDGPPFYSDGTLTAKTSDGLYQWQGGAWAPVTKPVVYPYADLLPGPEPPVLPPSFPGDRNDCPIYVTDNHGTVWAGRLGQLYHGIGDVWVPVPSLDTPLTMGQTLSSVLVDRACGVWFSLTGGDYTRVAHYRPAGGPPVLEWVATPPTSSDSGDVVFEVRCTGATAPAVWAWQLDENPLVFAKPGPLTCERRVTVSKLRNGTHVLRIRVYDGPLRVSRELSHRFEVRRDYAREIAGFIEGLRNADYGRREEAARGLANIGNPALPALRQELAAADEAMRWWYRAVIEEIEHSAAK